MTPGWHQSEPGQGAVYSALGCSGFGAPWLPPRPSVCCPRVTPRPQELVACVVALWWPKATPSTLQRVYCWHEHSELSGQSSPAQGGLGGVLGTSIEGQELLAASLLLLPLS